MIDFLSDASHFKDFVSTGAEKGCKIHNFKGEKDL